MGAGFKLALERKRKKVLLLITKHISSIYIGISVGVSAMYWYCIVFYFYYASRRMRHN